MTMDLSKKKQSKRKVYKISFSKAYLPGSSFFQTRIVADDFFLNKLSELQNKYDFEIVSVKLRGIDCTSSIRIKCTIEDKNKIFTEFCIEVGNYICNISF